jgi:hypothetical protein
VALTTHPHLPPKLKKEQAYSSTPPLGFRGLFWDELYLLFFYLYFSENLLRVLLKRQKKDNQNHELFLNRLNIT